MFRSSLWAKALEQQKTGGGAARDGEEDQPCACWSARLQSQRSVWHSPRSGGRLAASQVKALRVSRGVVSTERNRLKGLWINDGMKKPTAAATTRLDSRRQQHGHPVL